MPALSDETDGASSAAGLSVIVITHNEEANIGACLASVSFADEIVVVDSGSTDRTCELARAAGARVHQTADWPGFGPQKNRALDLATRAWVLSIDADERVTTALRDEIVRVVGSRESADAWEMPRRSSYCGQYMRHSGWYPDRVTRLFRRGSARFSDDVVHERVVAPRKPGRLRSDLLHESYRDFASVLHKVDRYSSAGAERMLAAGARPTMGSAIGHGLWAFVRTYILRLGILDGRLGLALAISNAEESYYRYLKAWWKQGSGA